jgi:hypothetical protein
MRVVVVLGLELLERLYWFVLIHQRVPAVVVTHEIGDDAPDGVGACSLECIKCSLVIFFGQTDLRYRRMGSATLNSRTPGGSTMRRHLMVATYCDKMSFVSAPGCSKRFRLLKTTSEN